MRKLAPHPWPSHRSKRRQRTAERACDRVLDQILDMPVVDEDDLPGEPMGRWRGLVKAGPGPTTRTPVADPSSGRHRMSKNRHAPTTEIREWLLGAES